VTYQRVPTGDEHDHPPIGGIMKYKCEKCFENVLLEMSRIPGNVLVSGGRLAGVLNAGGLGPADPALDLVAAWHLLDDGKSIRAMAEECGLLDLYRQTYYMASGVSHSEWWSIETHTMERCINVLHEGHLIPSLSLNPGGNTEFASTWVNQFYTLIQVSLKILGTDEEAVENTFAWLESGQEEESPTAR
jgi:hypothetical protein